MSGWTKAEIRKAKKYACKHANPNSFPTEGSGRYRGFETCPYCGRTAPMHVTFSEKGRKSSRRR